MYSGEGFTSQEPVGSRDTDTGNRRAIRETSCRGNLFERVRDVRLHPGSPFFKIQKSVSLAPNLVTNSLRLLVDLVDPKRILGLRLGRPDLTRTLRPETCRLLEGPLGLGWILVHQSPSPSSSYPRPNRL